MYLTKVVYINMDVPKICLYYPSRTDKDMYANCTAHLFNEHMGLPNTMDIPISTFIHLHAHKEK